MRFLPLVLILCSTLSFATAAISASASASTSTSATSAAAITTTPVALANPTIANGVSTVLPGLLFLVALVVVAAWLVKRSGGVQPWRSSNSLKVVAALSVGPRERVVLIELAGQQWLLGVAQGSVNTLHHFEQPIVSATGNAEDFSSKLRQLLPQGFGK